MAWPPRWRPAASAGLFALALLAAVWRLPEPAAPLQLAAPTISPQPSPSAWQRTQLPRAEAVAGPSTLTQLPDGRLAAAWLAGPVDEPDSAAIWLSTLTRQGWTPPHKIAVRESVAAGTLAHLGALGRPVLLAEGGWLHLWLSVAPPFGRLGGAIVHSVSTDGGKSWSRARRLPALAGGLSGPAQSLIDGGLVLPIASIRPDAAPAWLRLAATGRVVDKLQPTDQPATLPAIRGTPAILRLADGRLLLAGNPTNGSAALQLWLSTDAGANWTPRQTIAQASDAAAEFTHPCLLQSRDGRIHLTYTAHRQNIEHMAFSPTWLDAPGP